MTAEVISLKSRNVIEVLEEALADAKDGKLHAVVIVSEQADGQCSWSRGSQRDASIWRMIGGLESAKHALLTMEDR